MADVAPSSSVVADEVSPKATNGKHVPPQAKADPADRRERGKSLRTKAPRLIHAPWAPPANRRDPIDILIESSAGRLPDLVPIRFGRMLQSPFAFFRGAAAIMAADLASTPTTGLRVQACGDCHLLNFGAFATPERRLLFDINDFDETLPAPWEWDVKRLATSFVIASAHNSAKADDARDAALSCVRSYREHMAEYASQRVLEVWYASIELEELISRIGNKQDRQRIEQRVQKARAQSVAEHDHPKIIDQQDNQIRIHDNPPLIFHGGKDAEALAVAEQAFATYRESLPDERRFLLDRFKPVDTAIKVVGVGSVGTLCCIVLMMAGPKDPLFLQVKQARPSVLEPYAGHSRYSNHGHRVVVGQRLMQSASDLFLGWTEGREGRHFYVRQLHDMKIKPFVEVFSPSMMKSYATACGWCAASYVRTGDAVQISGYLGANDRFDQAIADFAEAYAGQNEQDHQRLIEAVREGRIEASVEN